MSLYLYVFAKSLRYATTIATNGQGIVGPSTGGSSCSSDTDSLLCISL